MHPPHFHFPEASPGMRADTHPAFFCLPELGLTQLLQFSTGETQDGIAMRKSVL
jgi:hypothetical protein